LSENHIKIIKFFLHISKDEQKKRLQNRLNDPSKNWKISESDFKERKYWDEYMKAYEEALNSCSTEWAPWYIIPANTKWFRNQSCANICLFVEYSTSNTTNKKERYHHQSITISIVFI
jgi:polyphosphate kinase 2 (PPK2 family)